MGSETHPNDTVSLIIKASISAEAAPTDTEKNMANSMYLLELALTYNL